MGKKNYSWSLHGSSVSPVILYSWLDGLAVILKFFRVLLAYTIKYTREQVVENRSIIGMKIIYVSKVARIRVLMWEILICRIE